jgi:hypothetical protein
MSTGWGYMCLTLEGRSSKPDAKMDSFVSSWVLLKDRGQTQICLSILEHHKLTTRTKAPTKPMQIAGSRRHIQAICLD